MSPARWCWPVPPWRPTTLSRCSSNAPVRRAASCSTPTTAAGRRATSAPGSTACRSRSSSRPARTRALSLGHQLAARLDDRFRLLTGGARTACRASRRCARSSTGATTCSSTDEQTRVRAAVGVRRRLLARCRRGRVRRRRRSPSDDIADILGHLVDKSLVIADLPPGRCDSVSCRRWPCSDANALRLAGPHATRARHAEHFGKLCARGTRRSGATARRRG